MSRMQIILAGEVVYDDVIEDWQAPPKPELIGPAVKATLDPNYKPPAFLKAMMLAMIGKAIDNALHDPRLQPLDVELITRPTGWTVAVDMQAPPDADTGRVDIGE